MGSKRKFSEFHAESSGNGESRDHNSRLHSSKNSNHKKTKTNPNNINWVKKRARTIERRFKTGQNMPANIQNDLERELAHHQQKIEDAADEKKRKKMIKKYHMVRFFERKKADRLAKKIKSQLKTATDEKEIEKLNEDLHRAEIDSIYTRYFPYRERYVSLYPVAAQGEEKNEDEQDAQDTSSAAQALHNKRPPLWKVIEEASARGIRELIIIRERKLDGDSSGKVRAKKDSKGPKTAESFATSESTSSRSKGKTKGGEKPESSDASDSEGGFFEED